MRVADICTRHVIRAMPSLLLAGAAELMRRHQVGALVVVDQLDDAARPVAMLTDRDIALALGARGADLSRLTVADVMTPAVVTCAEDDVLYDVIEMMRSRGVRRMPVVDARGVLAGVLSADVLVAAMAEQLTELARVLTYEQPVHLHDTDSQDPSD